MRADRLVSILLSLQVYGSMTTRALADRLEVSERTIHRDMDALSTVGIPIYALRGRNGGWSLSEEYRGSVGWLNAAEVQALAVRQPVTPLGDLGLNAVADAAWLKLVSGLPSLHRDEATRIADRIHIDVESWKPRQEQTPWLPLVKEAVLGDRLLDVRYRNMADGMSERTLAPLGLVFQGRSWYLVAMVGDSIRTWRVSRIDQARVRAERFDRPEGFALAAWWAQSRAEMAERLPRYPTRLLVAEAALSMLRRELRWGRIGESTASHEAGWQVVDVLFELEENALATVLALGPKVRVIEPETLRDAVIRTLDETRRVYDG
jgi:predicted DNA-binding transcriptional regulator YafY